jgi:uncharacterized protein
LRKRSCILFIAILFFSTAFARAAETPIPPAPASWITDAAGFLSPAAAQSLDAQLGACERSTGHQFFVYIGKTTGGVPIEDWAVRAFAAWKVGRKGLDDGLVLFIMTEDRRLRIEVGYGLEGQVSDVVAYRIINDIITPRIQAGDHDGAVAAGMNAVVQVVSGQGLSTSPAVQHPQYRSGRKPMGMGQLILIGIGVLLFLILLVTNPSLAIYLIASILSGGRGGGSSDGGGGGFGGGGGGRSGGGGASGSW